MDIRIIDLSTQKTSLVFVVTVEFDDDIYPETTLVGVCATLNGAIQSAKDESDRRKRTYPNFTGPHYMQIETRDLLP